MTINLTVSVHVPWQAAFDALCDALTRGDTEAAVNAAAVLVAGGSARRVGDA